MAFSYGDYNDELDHTLKAEEENTDSLFLFANNNAGTAENLGNYRLYDMKIEGDSEGVESGINYYDYITYYKGSIFDTNIPYRSGTTVEFKIGKSHEISGNCIIVQTRNNSVGYRDNGETIRSNLEANDNDKRITLKSDTNVYSYTFTKSETDFSYPYFCVGSNNSASVDNGFCSIEYWKFYYNNSLIGYFRPCVDTNGVQCLYDDVTQQYYYSSRLSTFSCKSYLRDFQPVLDKNNVPCLMDKINKKYYYAKNGKTFNCREQVGYRGVSYLQGDYNSYIDTGLRANEIHGYTIEIQYKRVTDYSRGNQLVFGSSRGGFDSSKVNCHLRYNYYGYPQGLSYSDEVSNAIYNPSVNTIINATFTINTPSSTSSFYLFAGNSNDSPIGTCDATIYYWKIYDTNSNLVQYLVPALDSSNVPCMYDKVSQQFFYNQGTGEFSYGIEELECPPANYAEYMDNNSCVFKLDVSRNPGELIGVKYKFMFTDKTPDTVSTSILSTTNGREGGSGWIYFVPSIGGTNFETRMGFGDGNHVFTSTIPFERNKEYEIEFDATDSKFRVNGVEMADTNTNPSASSRSYNLYLFTNTNNYAISDMRLYYVDIYKNHELVGSYRPCLDEDGNICLYNSVNKKYIYKDNSETPTIDNPRYTPITCIESNGTQYIDTGVVPTDNTDINMVCRSTNVTPYIKDGLILNLDGINNTMISHNSSTTVWEDLSGNGLNFNLNNITINDDSMSFNGTTSYANIQDIELWKTIANNTTEYDVELCFKFNNGESYQPIISSNYGLINVAKFVKYLQFKSTNFGLNLSSILGSDDWSRYDKFTISCNMNALLGYFNTTNYTLESTNDSITPPTSDNFSIGTRLTGVSYWFCGDIYSIRIYNRHLTDEERLYNHSVDVKRFDVTTDVITINTDNYIMNGLATDNTYKYNATDTTVEPNLTASTGATLTLGATNLAYLTEEEIEQATNDGWTLE